MLPDATEIQKLSELDPNIMTWLKERAEKEQDFRHGAFNQRLEIVSKTERGSRWINYLGLFFSFLLLGGGMYLSYTLIIEKHEIIGSIFSGVMLVAIASIFMSKVKSNNKEKASNIPTAFTIPKAMVLDVIHLIIKDIIQNISTHF